MITAISKILSIISTTLCLVGGIILGEQANDYIPQLQQAPSMVHVAVDVAVFVSLCKRNKGSVVLKISNFASLTS